MTALTAGETGYWGNLTPEQEEALRSLKTRLEADGLSLSGTVFANQERLRDQPPCSDFDLLRFLRARQFSVEHAYAMYSTAFDWRRSVRIDELYETFDWSAAERTFRRYYPTYFHGTDRTGCPVQYHELHKLDLDRLNKEIGQERTVQYLYLLKERNSRVRFPKATDERDRQLGLVQSKATIDSTGVHSSADGVGSTDSSTDAAADASAAGRTTAPIETQTTVLDLEGVGLMGFWKVKQTMQLVVQIGNDYYPESSHRIIFVNAPFVFATIWSYVKGLIHPRTAARVSILGADYQAQLREQIPEANLPKQYGGVCICEGVPGGCRNGDVGVWNNGKGVPHS